MAMVVLPLPGRPSTRYMRFGVNPPWSSVSRPAIPVDTGGWLAGSVS